MLQQCGKKHFVVWWKLMAVTKESAHSWERITWTIVNPLWTRQISHSNKCSKCLRNWCLSKMRSQTWKQWVGRIIQGNICHKLVTEESSIFSARRSTSFRILWNVQGRFSKILNLTMHGSEDSDGFNLFKIAETLTEFMVFQWNSSEIFSQISLRCSEMKKSTVYCADWEKHQKISQEEFCSCWCSTTFLEEPRKMIKCVIFVCKKTWKKIMVFHWS